MNIDFIIELFSDFTNTVLGQMEAVGPKVIAAVIVITAGIFISYGIYRVTMYIFKRFKIVERIEHFWDSFEEQTTQIVDKTPSSPEAPKKDDNKKNVQFDRITAKAFSYYIFLLFFRWAIIIIEITEIETFMQDLITYLPSLFIWIMIGFFGLRFANSVHDIIYQALELTKQKTSSIIAMWAKIIIMFFTLMIMLNYIKIVDQFIINSLFLGFITTLTISLWLAFGIGWKEIAKEILESFRK